MLGRQKWIALISITLVPLLAFAVSHRQQRLYEASTQVLVNEQNPTVAALNLNSSVASPPDRYAATQASLARVGEVAQLAVKGAGLPNYPPAALLANSSVSASPTADVLTFSVTDPTPAVATKLANSYATQFTIYRRRLDTASLSGAIAKVHRKLNAMVASGDRRSLLYLRLATNARDLEALQTLQSVGSSAVVVGAASNASLVQPKTRRNVILGLLVGVAVGIALTFLRESLDTRVRSADELRHLLGLPLLGEVPGGYGRQARTHRLATLFEPTGSDAEAFKTLRTSLDISQSRQPVSSIVITSTGRAEGKSTTAANLAVVLARSGRRVILLDLDLRRPMIASLFGFDDRAGITSVASGAQVDDVLNVVDIRSSRPAAEAGRLDVLTAGPRLPDPGEFLTSEFLPGALKALARRCDILLIDTPPLLTVGDAVAVARRADALILVARVNQVRRATLVDARRVLESCRARKLGVIATGGNSGNRLLGFGTALIRRLGQYPGRKSGVHEQPQSEGASQGLAIVTPGDRLHGIPDA
jgi:capsular exopolysaccharide synthesis family protein